MPSGRLVGPEKSRRTVRDDRARALYSDVGCNASVGGSAAGGKSIVRNGRQRDRERVRLLTNGSPGVRGFVKVDVGGGHGTWNAGNPNMVGAGAE
eukprot:2287512-Pleurochrysis_carterae.AAC.1